MADKKDYHVKLFNYACAPLVAYSVVAAYMGATYGMQSGWSWFSWHPFCMTIGFVMLAGKLSSMTMMNYGVHVVINTMF